MTPSSRQKQPFGKRKDLPRITLTHRGRVRSYAVRPWVFGTVLGLSLMFGTGYLGATAYLLYRDDLLGATMARQVQVQYDYEERIARLRAEVDRVTSRHAVETLGVEDQIAQLLARQEAIDARQVVLDELIGKARESGVPLLESMAPLPVARPGTDGARDPKAEPLAYSPRQGRVDPVAGMSGADASSGDAEAKQRRLYLPMLRGVQSALDRAEGNQHAALEALTAATDAELDRLTGVLKTIGMQPSLPEATGGPFIAVGTGFADRSMALERALEQLSRMRNRAAAMPLRPPVRGASISSRFGYRLDPFLRRRALHAGIDFRAEHGARVQATAPGRVVFAGWNGGYGRFIEIEHAGGLTTRYGHLSAVLVRAGDRVAAGTVIGRVGSTGRSTGPHLHYETRQEDRSVDPMSYLAAGSAL